MSVTAPAGFVAAGIACGIKKSRPDLSLVATADRRPVVAAGVFTTNLVAAAPVQLSRRHLAAGAQAAAVVLNSGNANAATGAAGLAVSEQTCAAVAAELGCATEDVLVCSTGLIGIPMAFDPIGSKVPSLVAGLGDDAAAGRAAATAIMTTDTVAKEAVATARLAGGATITVGGMAKGAAMLSPAMATMLAVVTTDAAVEAGDLAGALRVSVDRSFNRMLTDASRSTNDTVIALASGRAHDDPVAGPDLEAFTDALTSVCASLADQMAADAEGATKFVRIHVHGARDDDDAWRAARAVAASQLVKCSLYGADPYWGRVLSEMGASGAFLDPDRVEIAYNGVTVCRGGIAAPHDEAAVAASMTKRDIEIRCELDVGTGSATVTTVDLTPAYIDENMGTS